MGIGQVYSIAEVEGGHVTVNQNTVLQGTGTWSYPEVDLYDSNAFEYGGK